MASLNKILMMGNLTNGRRPVSWIVGLSVGRQRT
jgi:hypothetical protein